MRHDALTAFSFGGVWLAGWVAGFYCFLSSELPALLAGMLAPPAVPSLRVELLPTKVSWNRPRLGPYRPQSARHARLRREDSRPAHEQMAMSRWHLRGQRSAALRPPPTHSLGSNYLRTPASRRREMPRGRRENEQLR